MAKQKRLVFDIETDGLYENVTKIHCITIMALEGPRRALESFADVPLPNVVGTVQEGLERLLEASELIGHNIIGYDLPVLEKLAGWRPRKDAKITDTYVMSRLFNPDRGKPSGYTGKGGPHSLEAWGYRVSKAKPDHETWEVFDSAMLQRNREDVGINELTYNLLVAEAKGWNWNEALEIEHEVQRIITKQEIRGVNFDAKAAKMLIEQLDSRLRDIDSELLSNIPRTWEPVGVEVKRPFKVDGSYSKMVMDWYPCLADGADRFVAGPFTRIRSVELNLSSHSQVKDFLLGEGWEPTEWNYNDFGERTSPKLTEDSFGTIKGQIGNLIKERTLISHRKSQVLGWLERLREDGRISAGANTCGTNTGRFRHFGVVNVPKAADYVAYGKEMRSLFVASKGRKFVGHDASGLELRMLAHYMKDKGFSKAVVEGKSEDGTDVHTVNQNLAGLPSRDDAKTFIYGFLYGAGDEKIGSIIGGTSTEGGALRRKFLRNLPSLADLIRRVKRASKKGYLKGLDGRKVWMRKGDNGRVMEHKALNTLLQSAGAIVMKKSMIILDELVEKEGLDVWKVIDMHDEAQADVLEAHAERYSELAIQSVVEAGKHFGLNVPLGAESKIGLNWSETH